MLRPAANQVRVNLASVQLRREYRKYLSRTDVGGGQRRSAGAKNGSGEVRVT